MTNRRGLSAIPGLTDRTSGAPSTIAQPSTADTKASRLKDIANTLASGSKTIQSFLAAERSLEATNRLRARASGLLGIEPPEGKGVLDLGSKEGYLEGKGQADALVARKHLSNTLEEQGYFVDRDNPDTEVTNQKLTSFLKGYWEDTFGKDLMSNTDFMAGAAPVMGEATIESLLAAQDRLDYSITAGIANQAKTVGIEAYNRILEHNPETPQDLRGSLGEVRKGLAEEFNLSQAASSEVLLRGITENIRESQVAIMRDPTSGERDIDKLVNEAILLRAAVLHRDKDNIPFGGITRSLGSGDIVPTLGDTFGDIDTMISDLVESQGNRQALSRDMLELNTKNEIRANLGSGMDYRNILRDISTNDALRDKDPELYAELIDYVSKVGPSGDLDYTSDSIGNSYVLKVYRGEIQSEAEVASLVNSGKLPMSSEGRVLKALDRQRATKIRQRTEDTYRRGLRTQEDKDNADALRNSNNLRVEQFLRDKNETRSPVINRLRKITSYMNTLSDEELESEYSSIQFAYAEEERLAAEEAQHQQRAEEYIKARQEEVTNWRANLESAQGGFSWTKPQQRRFKEAYLSDETKGGLTPEDDKAFANYHDELLGLLSTGKPWEILNDQGEITDQKIRAKLILMHPYSSEEEYDGAIRILSE